MRRHPTIRIEEMEINIMPLIDVVFLLIIFFMVTTTFKQLETDQQVKLPEASAAEPDERRPGILIVNVRRTPPGGIPQVSISNKLYTLDELPLLFKKAVKANPAQAVVIRGDSFAYHEYFIKVMEACASAGITSVRVAVKIEEE